MRYAIIGIFFGVLVISVSTYIFLGAYKSVQLTDSSLPALKVISQSHIGPYHQINIVISKVESWAKNNNLKCNKTFGEYLDNPEFKKEEELRANAGCIIEENEILPAQIPNDMQIKEYSSMPAVKAIFTGSPALGPIKVYPQAKDILTAQNKALKRVIEIYQIHNQKDFETQFYFLSE